MLAHQILAAAGQAWPAFALVAGLLLTGAVIDADGQFEAVGAYLARAPLPPGGLLLVLLALVAGVTAVLNLDTSVVFLTPVLVHAARRRGFDERPLVYGSVFMANAASVLLPGSNLTNLLVLEPNPVGGARFGEAMLPAWVVACALTAGFVALAFRLEHGDPGARAAPPLRLGAGTVSALAAAVLVLVLRDPAPEVLLLGLVAAAVRPGSPAARRAPARPVVRACRRARRARARMGRAGAAARCERPLDDRCDRSGRVGAREQPACRRPPLRPGTTAPARAPARSRPRPEPRRNRVALGVPLASGRTFGRRGSVARRLLAARGASRPAHARRRACIVRSHPVV